MSAICYTVPKSAKGSSLYMLESGSDFKSRGLSDENRLVLGPGVTVVTCDVTLIDDSEYEEEEEFEVVLADASDNARIGSRASANVVIAGPNDASTVFLGNATFTVSEAAGEELGALLGCSLWKLSPPRGVRRSRSGHCRTSEMCRGERLGAGAVLKGKGWACGTWLLSQFVLSLVCLVLQDTLRSQCSGRALTSPRPRRCGAPRGHQTRPRPAQELIMSPAPGK